MTIQVFPWPPVCAVGRSWQLVQPVAALRSALTGRDQMQSSDRARRMVMMEVPAVHRTDRAAAGYMEMLGNLLAGGVNAVRLTGWNPNIRSPSKAHEWLSIGMTASAVTVGGVGAWRVEGLPPRFPLVLPGERFRVGATLWQSINRAVADGSGVATIRVIGATSGSGALTLDQQESAVFRVNGEIPTGMQIVGNWSYSWSLREVFADEVGGFTEFGAEIWT